MKDTLTTLHKHAKSDIQTHMELFCSVKMCRGETLTLCTRIPIASMQNFQSWA